MDLEIFILGGYGQFVWPAFIFTFVSCFILYKKTKKELLKQEKLFLKEYEKLSPVKIKTVEEKKITKEALSGSSI
tara:strand:- start:189 stop:413 length:225 start_codon:yes stop_codon:yes gene_type:complete